MKLTGRPAVDYSTTSRVTSSKGERAPLPPGIYNLVQRAVSHGIERLYLPVRAEALAWEGLADREILEVGCGTGVLEGRGVAIDLDLRRVRQARATGRLAAAGDATRLPFRNGAFALAYCEGVLHHLDDGAALAALCELLRVCRADGRVVLIDNVWPRSPLRVIPWLLRRADFGRHVRTEEQLRGVLRDSGGQLVWARRLTYTTIGLEGLISVLTPAAVPSAAKAGDGLV